MTVQGQKSEVKISLKTIAQVLFIAYIFALYVFSFQLKYVNYTEYLFFLFAGLVILHVIAKGQLLLTKAHYCMLAFCFVSFLSGLWALDSSLTITTSFSLLFLALMSILVYQVFDKKDVDKLLKAVLFAGVALVIYTAVDVGVSEYFDGIFTGERLGGTMSAANTFGVYCSISLVAGVYLFRKKKWLYALALIILFSGILASASRNAFIITTIGVVLSFLFAFKNAPFTKKVFYLALFSALIFVIYQLGYFDSIFARFENLDMDAAAEAGQEIDPSFGSRLFMIRFGFEKFFSKPLFGYGIANAQLLLEKEWIARTYLHNNYVELLVNVGLVGFALYYAVHVLVLKGLFKNRETPLDACEAMIALIVVLLAADMSIVFYYNKLTYVILTIAMLLGKEEARETEKIEEET